jgi:cytochrome P450
MDTFFLAMILQPEAQRKAQSELDAVLGHCTAPQPADRPRLPYTEALISEVFRSYSIGPVGKRVLAVKPVQRMNPFIGLPHVAAEDDVHEGFFIPKDTMIITNNW